MSRPARTKDPKWRVSAFDGRWQSRDRINDGHNDSYRFADEASALEFIASKLRYKPAGDDAYIRMEERVNYHPYNVIIEAWDGTVAGGWVQVASRKKKPKRGEAPPPQTKRTVKLDGHGRHDGLSFGVVHEDKLPQIRKLLDDKMLSRVPWTVPDDAIDEYSSYADACSRAIAHSLSGGEGLIIVFVTDKAAAYAWDGREGVERFTLRHDAQGLLRTPVQDWITINAHSKACR